MYLYIKLYIERGEKKNPNASCTSTEVIFTGMWLYNPAPLRADSHLGSILHSSAFSQKFLHLEHHINK